MAIKVGELYATLGIDDSEFKKALRSGGNQMSAFGKDLQAMGSQVSSMGAELARTLTAGIVAVGGAILAATYEAGKFGEEMKNLSATTGLSLKTLQQYRFVTKSVGLDFEVFANTSTMLQRKLMGIEDDTGHAAKSMDRMGIDVHDTNGELKSMDTLMPEVITHLQGITNATERNMLATQIFGRNLGAIAPLLAMSSKEMDEMKAKAGVMSDAQIEMAAKFQQSVNEIRMRLDGLLRKFGMELMPLIKEQVIPFIEKRVIPAFKWMATEIGNLARILMRVPTPILVIVGAFGAFLAGLGPLLVIIGALITSIGSIIEVAPVAATAFSAIWDAALGPIGWVIAGITAIVAVVGLLYNRFEPFRTSVNQAWDAIKNAANEVWKSLQQLYQAVKPLLEVFGNLAKMQIKATFEALGFILKVVVDLLKQVVDAIADVVRAIGILISWFSKKPAGGGFLERVLDSCILIAKKMPIIAAAYKEHANQIRIASEEQAQSVLDSLQKQMDAADKMIDKQKQAAGWTSGVELWKSAMTAGAKVEVGSSRSSEITAQNLPNTDKLNEIKKGIDKLADIHQKLLDLTRERLGAYAR